MYTIKPNNFEYLRHVTVQIPVRDQSSDCNRYPVHWSHFEGIQKKRGMLVPHYEGEDKATTRPSPYDQHCYGKAVSRAFEYLKWIPRLWSLEFTVPAQYGFIAWSGIEPHCSVRYLESLRPTERVRHVVEDHCNEDFWKLLKELKQQSASEELRIAFVMIHDATTLDAAADDYLYQGRMRAARWLAAYAKIQGYGFGHARWAEGTYCVEYDEDVLLALPHKWDETDEAAKLREPSENIVQEPEQLEEEHRNASAEECSSFSTWQ
ncbi:hypothetical protein MPH_05027 [Macrophomina phaseolina MS6]|uniref:Uncharacterized protein n=1 Tax=Macrophomina phaseolina (strain MS6) TaxID=1126212 RepID=K2R5Q6_MACPH|nr:hypothetical protein MPH_05027 [Macrophomina phaseolina MS6]